MKQREDENDHDDNNDDDDEMYVPVCIHLKRGAHGAGHS
jgi:hypothetical protein